MREKIKNWKRELRELYDEAKYRPLSEYKHERMVELKLKLSEENCKWV